MNELACELSACSVSSSNAAVDDLDAAVASTALLDTSASKAKRELTSSGGLAGRRLPSHLHQSDSMVSSVGLHGEFSRTPWRVQWDSVVSSVRLRGEFSQTPW